MNLPNKLTLSRIILVPFFVAALLIDFPFHWIAALLLFIVASVTDLLDGKIARKKGLITDFGKFADPLADKILVTSALLCFLQLGLCDSVAIIIVLFREFTVTSIRLVAASKGEVVAANIWGKIKTVVQMVAIITILTMQGFLGLVNDFGLFGLSPEVIATMSDVFKIIGFVLIWISTVLALISGIIYIIQNKKFIQEM